MKCELCNAPLKLRERKSGEKEGHRYWVCSRYPECTYKKLYAEQGKRESTWSKVGRIFVKTN